MINWNEIHSVEDVVGAFPELVEAWLRELRVGGLATEPAAACRQLLDRYRRGTSFPHLRLQPPEVGNATDETAEKYAEGWFNKKENWHRLERDAAGHLRWDTRTGKGGEQFFNNLNRHFMFEDLFKAYRQTGNPRYVEALNRHFLDWLTFTAERNELDYGKNMQVALRMPIWARIFFGTLSEPRIDEALHLLILIHIPTQARHLIANPLQNNGLTMTLYGLLTCALSWPEFREAAEWERIATERLIEMTDALIYPDGVATELSATYHGVTRSLIDRASCLLTEAGRPLPERIGEKLRLAYGYTPDVMRPDGSMPMNNDSDRGNGRSVAREAAQRFGRADWDYVASNGATGERPPTPPSRAYPWGGQVVMRSDWSREAHWSFFDIGPWGEGHQHNDMLHFSLHAHGRDLLVDSGRFWYEGGPIRYYALSGAAHNTVLLDGYGQVPDRKMTAAPAPHISLRHDFDFAMGRFSRGFGPLDAEQCPLVLRRGVHTRALLYLRERCWLVVDRIESDEAASFSTLWHFHPDCTVAAEGAVLRTTDPGQGNLTIRPVAGVAEWDVECIQGREEPIPQGWYSVESYAEWQRNVVAECRAPLCEGAALAVWLIVPGRGTPPEWKAENVIVEGAAVRLRLEAPGGWRADVAVNMGGTGPIPLEGGHRLVGHAAVALNGAPPQAACGRIEDAGGRVIDDDAPAPKALLDNAMDTWQVDADDHQGAGNVQHFRLRIHNPLIADVLEVDVSSELPTGWSGVVRPARMTLAAGASALIEIEARSPGTVTNPRGGLHLQVRGAGVVRSIELPLPLRSTAPWVLLAEDQHTPDLRQCPNTARLEANGEPAGQVRLARLGRDRLALAIEAGMPGLVQVECFFDTPNGRRPIQLVLEAGAHTPPGWHHLAHPLPTPPPSVVSFERDGCLCWEVELAFADLGVEAAPETILFEAAFVSKNKEGGIVYQTLFGSEAPYLDSRGYARVFSAIYY